MILGARRRWLLCDRIEPQRKGGGVMPPAAEGLFRFVRSPSRKGTESMMRKRKYLLRALILSSVSIFGFTAAAQQAATEAPAGFDTPTLVVKPGSQSVSNGIAEPTGDTYALDQQVFEEIEDVNS